MATSAISTLSGDSLQRQHDLLRFSEELQGVLTRCGDESGVCAAVVHRIVFGLGGGGRLSGPV